MPVLPGTPARSLRCVMNERDSQALVQFGPRVDNSAFEVKTSSRSAFVSVLYGDKMNYFLGAMVLGWSLRKNLNYDAVLVITPDVPEQFRNKLQNVYDQLIEVQYLTINKHVSTGLYNNPGTTRFGDVFTKLQVLCLEQYEKVLFLDLDILVRDPAKLGRVFEEVAAPAALLRGNNTDILHGDEVPYERFWQGYDRRVWTEASDRGGEYREELRSYHQASGINAGVMLLRPSHDMLAFLKAEIGDWYHPQHYERKP